LVKNSLCEMEEEAFRNFIESELKKNPNFLKLSYLNINSENTKILAEILSNNTSVQYLDLTCNNVGDKGAQEIANSLKENKTLQYLNLCCNSISDEGGKSLARSLHESVGNNTTLQHLDLSMNKLGDETVFIFAEVLEKNSSLVTLSLRSNKFTSKGVDSCLKILAIATKSPSLKDVFI
jgi:Ran GTPase-activating protein (RanGAP) involved in mRNA processing and transport